MSDPTSPPPADDADLDVGPAPGDENEFARVPAPPRRRPLVAVAVMALGGVLAFHLRADLRYGLQSRTPVDLGDARTLQSRGVTLEDNRYVTLSGLPDRRNALFIEPRGERVREAFFRLLGTQDRVLVRAQDTSNRTHLEDRWTGRLRRVDALPAAPSLRAYFTERARARRFIGREALTEVLSKGDAAASVRDRAGEPLTVQPGAALEIDLVRPGLVRVLLSREKFAAAADAQKELERLGLQPVADIGPAESYAFVVPVGEGAARDALLEKLSAKGFVFQAADLTWGAARGALRVEGVELVMQTGELLAPDGTRKAVEAQRLPLASVTAASLDEPITLAADAFVLTEGETPAGVAWAPFVFAMLVAFMLFNGWYLLVRPRRA